MPAGLSNRYAEFEPVENRTKILIIDDEEAARYGIRRALTNPNYDIEEAADGYSALNGIAKMQPDVILSDINMPEMDGITLLRHLKESPEAPPVVLITAHGSEELAIEAIRAGAYDYIHKPFEIEELRAIIRNAAEARRLVLENRFYYQKLEQTLAELRDSQAALVQSEKMGSMAALVAGVSHEVHTPLGVIASSADTMARAAQRLRQATPDPELLERTTEVLSTAAEQLHAACERVRAIIANLRHFVQLDRADLLRAHIEENLESTLRLLGYQLAGKITVEKDYGTIPEIECFPRELNQLFMNVLLNAIEAIDRSGRKGTIRIRTWQEGDGVAVQVEDNGCGIAEDKLNRIFDPGFTTKNVRVGIGLGLAISYRIVQAHHGELDIESRPEVGTKVTIKLPIKAPEKTAS
jgi:signal transduction histidine kinase